MKEHRGQSRTLIVFYCAYYVKQYKTQAAVMAVQVCRINGFEAVIWLKSPRRCSWSCVLAVLRGSGTGWPRSWWTLRRERCWCPCVDAPWPHPRVMAEFVLAAKWKFLFTQWCVNLFCSNDTIEKDTSELKYNSVREKAPLDPQQILWRQLPLEKSGLLCHHVLGTLPIATECWSPKQTDGHDDRVDQALEEQ